MTTPARLLEVRQRWNESCLDVQHFRPNHRAVTIGGGLPASARVLGLRRSRLPESLARFLPAELPTHLATAPSDFAVDERALDAGEDRQIATWTDAGWVVAVEPSWTAHVQIDGAPCPLDELVAQGRAARSGAHTHIPIDDDLSLQVDLGAVQFDLRTVPADRARRHGPVAWLGLSVVGEALFLGLLSLFAFIGLIAGLIVALLPGSPDSTVYAVDDRFLHATRELVQPTPEPTPREVATNAPSGEAARRSEGRTGRPEARRAVARGDRTALDQRQADRQIVENAGLLGSLADQGGVAGEVVSAAMLDGIGGLTGPNGVQIGGGLGERKSGLGGGGSEDGIGGMGTHGSLTGDGTYGRNGGNFGNKSEGALARADGEPILIGAMDRAQIERVIKNHLNQVRYCYQRELGRNPSMQGKVSVRFTIAGDGTVSSAQIPTSQLGSTSVDQCIIGRFHAMQFPEPKGGGRVVVTYPFLFSPS